MKAMRLHAITDIGENSSPLSSDEVPRPEPGRKEVLIRVEACGVCHTELDEIEGRTAPPSLPVIPGHEVAGTVEELGDGVETLSPGDRVGVGWFYSSCGRCSYCLSGNGNLCSRFRATGRDHDGGYAQYMTVPENSAFVLPEYLSSEGAAPLLCAGAIGYRSLRLSGIGNGDNLGLTGFGGSAHLVLKMVKARFPESDVFVFARSESERDFALSLGAVWAGDTAEPSPAPLQAVIDTTPAWKPVVEAMTDLAPGGRLVINAIRKENADREHLLKIDYSRHLWMEKEIKSVANVSRRDIFEFLQLAEKIRILPEVQTFALEEANEALVQLRRGNVRGAKVLRIGSRS